MTYQTMNPAYPDHLQHVDASMWPGVVHVPEGRVAQRRAQIVEARFALACEKAGLNLDPQSNGGPDIRVHHDELFYRLAESGWLGLAESYMAGEWDAENLPRVLAQLIKSGFSPRRRWWGTPTHIARADYSGEELSAQLVQLFSTDGYSTFGGIFASGVPTTVRTAVTSHVSGAGRRHEPSSHFVDITHIDKPVAVERQDLRPAQDRAVKALLDAARVTEGTDLLEFPLSGGTLALAAARRGASVDTLSADAEHCEVVRGRLEDEDAAFAVTVQHITTPIPTRQEWRGRYDAIVSIETLEKVGKNYRKAYALTLDRLLTTGGYAALQNVVATEKFAELDPHIMDVTRAYIWPALDFPTMEDIHRLFDRETSLRVVAENHTQNHYKATLHLQRELFESHMREAAAAGIDQVYRRLWQYHLALMEALCDVGALDCVQLTLTSRNRGGWR
ncbi:cyclopropane fatty acyl phospholipid synthase [Corynebacterium durum]|nr:class I SAM-dependent methyltransferase [Corynebacterium durum]NYI73347.1 cyclopropane-fatty-acyl-phospholipid synthase [Corynebacterium durum]WJY85071.1 cyclopropane fatty acyl phospholipid synthase [Corynebacterium durum]